MNGAATLKAPFPYFGGKSKIAARVWARLGDPQNYVEPFFGSGAMLLARPESPQIETVNDLDGLLCNFWRAIRLAPGAVADAADFPVNETELHARHSVLVESRDELSARLEADPDYFDPKLAGWWVWGACAWIGSGWCDGRGPWQRVETEAGLRLVNARGNAGRGINRQLPHLGDAGRGIKTRREYIEIQFEMLAARLRDVRVACGDWRRVLTNSVTLRQPGVTGVFLDPPYGVGAMDYGAGSNTNFIAQEVAAWALENGDNPRFRIAYAGYEGEVDFPGSWQCLAWKTAGGYGGGGGGDADANRSRERVWFSPHCLTT